MLVGFRRILGDKRIGTGLYDWEGSFQSLARIVGSNLSAPQLLREKRKLGHGSARVSSLAALDCIDVAQIVVSVHSRK